MRLNAKPLLGLCTRALADLMEDRVTLVKFNFEELLLVKASSDILSWIRLYENDVFSSVKKNHRGGSMITTAAK